MSKYNRKGLILNKELYNIYIVSIYFPETVYQKCIINKLKSSKIPMFILLTSVESLVDTIADE